MNWISARWKKLRDKKYREEFVAAQAKRAIPFQIRALMRKKGISQQQLAERSGLTQGVISRAANPTYGRLTLNTILRVAAGFDMAFIGIFVPFGKLESFFDRMSEEQLGNVLTFSEEDAIRTRLSEEDQPTATDIQQAAKLNTGNATRMEKLPTKVKKDSVRPTKIETGNLFDVPGGAYGR